MILSKTIKDGGLLRIIYVKEKDWAGFSVKALETLPIAPNHGKITFFADGVMLDFDIEPFKGRYERQCEAYGIIPRSEVALIGKKGCFSMPASSTTDRLKEEREVYLPELIYGKKINKIVTEFNDAISYEALRKEKIPYFTQKGYRIGSPTELSWLADSGFKGLPLLDTSIKLVSSSPGRIIESGLDINIGTCLSENKIKKLKKWYDSLREEYHGGGYWETK